jgi:hypothetical protein
LYSARPSVMNCPNAQQPEETLAFEVARRRLASLALMFCAKASVVRNSSPGAGAAGARFIVRVSKSQNSKPGASTVDERCTDRSGQLRPTRLLGVRAISCGASCGAGLDSPYPKRQVQSILGRTNRSQIVLDSTILWRNRRSINEPIATSAPAISSRSKQRVAEALAAECRARLGHEPDCAATNGPPFRRDDAAFISGPKRVGSGRRLS